MDVIKWEYKYIDVRDLGSETDLEKVGKEGWEVTGVTSYDFAILKRPCGKIQVIEKENTAEVEIKQSADFNLDQKKTGGWGY